MFKLGYLLPKDTDGHWGEGFGYKCTETEPMS